MKMNDNTILRIKVPAHLYESVKAQLTLNEANLTLNSYAKKLYSLFKKEGATPVLITGKGKAGDLAKSNVAIVVKDGKFDFAPYGYFSVDIKGTKAIAEKYANLVAQTFPDLEKIGNIEIKPGWGGEGGNDTTATVKLRPKTTGGKPEDSFGGKGVGTTKVTETDDIIQEAKGKKMYGAGMEEVKGQKAAGASSDKPKAPKKPANAPQKATGAMYDEETSKLGAGVSEAKKMGLEEFKALAELLNNEIMKLEEKEKGAEKKEPVEEKKEAGHEQEGQE